MVRRLVVRPTRPLKLRWLVVEPQLSAEQLTSDGISNTQTILRLTYLYFSLTLAPSSLSYTGNLVDVLPNVPPCPRFS
jgi:hypothetical protein